jgi:hypothetical protein
MAETVLFLKDDEKKKDNNTQTNTNDNTERKRNTNSNKRKNGNACCCIWKPCDRTDTNNAENWCSCFCFWMPLADTDSNERDYETPCRWLCKSLDGTDDKTSTSWRSCCCIRWLFKDRKTGEDLNKNTENETNKKTYIPPWCICSYIWKFFAKVFQCKCRCWKSCKCCKCRGCDFTSKDCENCLINFSSCCCECDCRDGDLKNKLLPHHLHLNLRRAAETRYFGFIYLNINRTGIYLLLCSFLWCGAVVCFEGIVLGYATAQSGDSCPTPKRGTPATVVDCFIFQNAFETTPINTTYATRCNASMTITFTGSSASCFAWIYADVDVVDVIEELGICAGIVALLGSCVAVMSYLCRKHRWRFAFDTIAVLAVLAIPILVYRKGKIPFMTYILLGTLAGAIAMTEYILGYVPFITGICLGNRIFSCIKYRYKPNISNQVTPWA